MGSEALSGSVSGEDAPGETVTITVTKLADNTTAALPVQTQQDGSFAAPYTDVPGDYSAVAHIDADVGYTAADSTPFTFTLTQTARTITLTGSPA